MRACLPVFLLFAITWSSSASAGDCFAWPEGRKAAVSLAYDDALDSQLDTAIPALDRHGLKGSFYLILSAQSVRTRLADWRTAAANGHELGNHSLFHQCSGKGPDRSWVAPQRNLDTTTVAQMRDQVELASTMLQAIDGRSVRTYTVPCGEAAAMDGNYLDAVAPLFAGIKLIGNAVVDDMATLDPSAVPVAAPVGVSGAQLIALVEEARRKGTMVNFTFHGIGGDHLQVSAQAHEELLAYLDAHRDDYGPRPSSTSWRGCASNTRRASTDDRVVHASACSSGHRSRASRGRTTRANSRPTRSRIKVGHSLTWYARPSGRPRPSSMRRCSMSACASRHASMAERAAMQCPHQSVPKSSNTQPGMAATVAGARLRSRYGRWRDVTATPDVALQVRFPHATAGRCCSTSWMHPCGMPSSSRCARKARVNCTASACRESWRLHVGDASKRVISALAWLRAMPWISVPPPASSKSVPSCSRGTGCS